MQPRRRGSPTVSAAPRRRVGGCAVSGSIPAEQVPLARRAAHRFLQRTAPALWAKLMADGDRFHIPKEFAPLGASERARQLAAAEAQRLAKARLFHVDAVATRLALQIAGNRQPLSATHLPTRKVLPAEYGLVVWAEPVASTEHGDPLVACHWEAQADGVWVAWWTDTTLEAEPDPRGSDVEERIASAIRRQLTGRLCYDREFWFPHGPGQVAWKATVPARERVLLTELIGVTVATWGLLTLRPGVVKVRQRRPPRGAIEGIDPVPGADDTVTAVTGRGLWSPRVAWLALRLWLRPSRERDRRP